MTDLVVIESGHVFTDSRTVAERFGKRHTHVCRSIDKLIADGQCASLRLWFACRVGHRSKLPWRS